MRDMIDVLVIQEAIERFSFKVHTHMLIVDGNTLSIIVREENLKERFF